MGDRSFLNDSSDDDNLEKAHRILDSDYHLRKAGIWRPFSKAKVFLSLSAGVSVGAFMGEHR